MTLHLPDMFLALQQFPDRRLQHPVPDVVAEQMRLFSSRKFKRGARIAIAVGSRGINNHSEIVRAVVDYFKSKNYVPFIVPAMGSHGGATAQGQKTILADSGITESTMGCKIESSMETVLIGHTEDGIPVYIAKAAYESDGIFSINRVKPHTDFEGEIESGLIKMEAVGLGKKSGAETCHRLAYEGRGMEKVLRAIHRRLLQTGKMIGGLAVLEDANNNTAELVALRAADIEEQEKELLAKVKRWRGFIPVKELDLLIIEEIGKNISGPGMDPKIINRSSTTGALNLYKRTKRNPRLPPWIGRIYVRSLSERSKGNAMGIGLADIVHDRVLRAARWEITRTNAMTAQIPGVIKRPLHYATDHRCLQELMRLMGHGNLEQIKIGWIRNTAALNVFIFSENLREEVAANPHMIIAETKIEPFSYARAGRVQLASRPFDRAAAAIVNCTCGD